MPGAPRPAGQEDDWRHRGVEGRRLSPGGRGPDVRTRRRTAGRVFASRVSTPPCPHTGFDGPIRRPPKAFADKYRNGPDWGAAAGTASPRGEILSCMLPAI